MKRSIAAVLAALLVLAGCTARNDNPPSSSEAPPSSSESSQEESVPSLPEVSPMEEIQVLEHAVREFGEEDAILQYDKNFSCKILYPVSGMEAVDQVIAEWAKQVYDEAAADMVKLSTTSDNPDGSLTYNYNSYLIQDRYASVEEVGFYAHSGLAHPIEPIAIFNIDLQAQRILASDELFTSGGQEQVLQLLADRLKEQEPDAADILDAAEMDEGWLSAALLRPDGVEIILERGSHLPGYLGTQRVLLSYEELGDALAIGSNLGGETEQPPAEQSQQPSTAPSTAIDTSKPMIALTFDDGPTVTTAKILGLLKEHGGSATFFMVGNSVQSKAEIVQQMVAQGSEVANHTWDHKPLNKLTSQDIRQQLQATSDVLYEVCGVRPVLMRPPYGAFNDTVQSVTAEMGTPIINWSVDTLDWKTRNATDTYNAIMRDVKNGSIILCHDLHKETGEAMVTVIPKLISDGYQLVTVSQLLEATQGPPQPGTVYTSGQSA